MSFFKSRISFHASFASTFSVMTQFLWNLLAEALRLGQKEAIKLEIFRLLSVSMKVHRTPHAPYSSRFTQIFHHWSVSQKITPLCFFYLKPLQFGQKSIYKKGQSKWRFLTFECLDENSPNFLCHIWNYKSVFL